MHPHGQMFLVLRCLIIAYGIMLSLKFMVMLYVYLLREAL